jgi:hypothetical protein
MYVPRFTISQGNVIVHKPRNLVNQVPSQNFLNGNYVWVDCPDNTSETFLPHSVRREYRIYLDVPGHHPDVGQLLSVEITRRLRIEIRVVRATRQEKEQIEQQQYSQV